MSRILLFFKRAAQSRLASKLAIDPEFLDFSRDFYTLRAICSETIDIYVCNR